MISTTSRVTPGESHPHVRFPHLKSSITPIMPGFFMPIGDKALHAITGDGNSCSLPFAAARCISNNTINAALRRLGYSKEQMVGHGICS